MVLLTLPPTRRHCMSKPTRHRSRLSSRLCNTGHIHRLNLDLLLPRPRSLTKSTILLHQLMRAPPPRRNPPAASSHKAPLPHIRCRHAHHQTASRRRPHRLPRISLCPSSGRPTFIDEWRGKQAEDLRKARVPVPKLHPTCPNRAQLRHQRQLSSRSSPIHQARQNQRVSTVIIASIRT